MFLKVVDENAYLEDFSYNVIRKKQVGRTFMVGCLGISLHQQSREDLITLLEVDLLILKNIDP